MTTTINGQVRAVLAAGLAWLYETEQPATSALQHHGVFGPRLGDRRYRFIPADDGKRPVVVVDVPEPLYDTSIVSKWQLLNPIGGDEEMLALAATVRDLGYDTGRWWNGNGESGSLGLASPAHPTLLAAVDRYKAGCLEHPRAGVFCTCPWYRPGRALLVEPTWPAVTR